MACQLILDDRPLIDDESAVTAHVDLAGTPSAAAGARTFVRDQLEGVISDSVLDDCLLLTSELVTNAVLHARTGVHLGVTRDTINVLVTVQDRSEAAVSAAARDAAPDRLAETGRGMAIVASLADDFGWRRLPDEIGKVMWFLLAVA